MRDELFNLKALLEVIFRITTISANRFAQDHLHKDPAVIARWKTGRKIPSIGDLSIISEVASKKSIANQRVQIRKEIEYLVTASTLSEEFKNVILGKEDFKEFLLEALSTSVIKASQPQPSKYQEQLALEILEDIACIDSRLYHLYRYEFYNAQSTEMDMQQVAAFTKEMNNFTVKTEFKDGASKFENEKGLNPKYIQSFYDEIAELSSKYNSFMEFLIAVANNSTNQGEIQSCYIEFINVSMDIIRSSTNIAYITGLLALGCIGKPHQGSSLTLKSIAYLDAGEMSEKPEIAINCFSSHVTDYSTSVDKKAILLERMRTIKKQIS